MDAPLELWRFHNLDESPPPDLLRVGSPSRRSNARARGVKAARRWSARDWRGRGRKLSPAGAREIPVDGRPSADPFAGHGVSPLAQSGNRRPRCVREPSRRLGQIDDGCAVGSPQQVDHQRQLAAVSRSGRRGVSADVIETDAILRLRKKLRLRRLAGLDRVLRSLVDGHRFLKN